MVSFLQLVGFTLVIQNLPKILIDLLPDLHEARAILGRLGRHDQALETYVYRLQDFMRLKSKPSNPRPRPRLDLLSLASASSELL